MQNRKMQEEVWKICDEQLMNAMVEGLKVAPENGGIPVNPEDLPINNVLLEDDKIYEVELTKVAVSPKLSKRDKPYFAIQCVVTDGDFEGITLMRQYIEIPWKLDPDAPKRDRIQFQQSCRDLGRFCKAFKVKGQVVYADREDGSWRESFAEWLDSSVGNRAKVSIQNQEFPEGSGKFNSSINDFVFDN